jgi:aryl-alcohol dehydrogenase-like predicted oxidoreductase
MEFRRLGSSGLVVSVVGLGTNNLGRKLDETQSKEVVTAALDQGITFFDTADVYGASEERLGALLDGVRDDVVIATKFGHRLRGGPNDIGEDWNARGSRRYVVRAVEASLRRLRTDWIDLYQLHSPDPKTPIEETLSALSDLVHQGKVRYVGSSQFSGWQIAHAEWVARTRGFEHFVSAQNQYSLLDRELEADVVPALLEYDLGLLPFFPLANGLLTGKYRRGQPPPAGSRIQVWKREALLTDDVFDKLEDLDAFAQSRGVTMLDVAIGGLAAQPAVASVIAGATSAEQVAQNVAAGTWKPTEADLEELNEIV